MWLADDADSVNWQAQRYVLGELDRDECRRWEQLLDTDQAAREAVARAAELLDGVRIVEAEPAAADYAALAPRRIDTLLSPIVGACLVAGLVLALALLPVPKWADQNADLARVRVAETAELAVVWSDNHQFMSIPLWPTEQLDETPPEPSVGAGAFLGTAGDGHGTWIQEAVVGLSQQTGMELRPVDPM